LRGLIGIGVNSNSADSEAPRGSEDPAGNFAAVRNQ
jgi:hypothetical protein